HQRERYQHYGNDSTWKNVHAEDKRNDRNQRAGGKEAETRQRRRPSFANNAVGFFFFHGGLSVGMAGGIGSRGAFLQCVEDGLCLGFGLIMAHAAGTVN